MIITVKITEDLVCFDLTPHASPQQPSPRNDPEATMTSRFGKTYSRKGGEGTSKFDEVLSSKRGTLSTKWGATTYKAKVGSKRAGTPKNDSLLEVCKRPQHCDDGADDPFGFDSDEESKPVSSRAKSSAVKPAEPPQAERPTVSVDTGSKSNLQGGFSNPGSREGPSWLDSGRKQSWLLEDTSRFFTSSSAHTGPTQSSSAFSQNQHSYSWYQNASESDKKPLAQTTTLKTGPKAESTYDSWDAIMAFRSPSPDQEPRNPAPTLSWVSASVGSSSWDRVATQIQKSPSPSLLHTPIENKDFNNDLDYMETSESTQTSSSTSLVRNSNCRTYRRPNKQNKTSDSCGLSSSANSADMFGSGNNNTTEGRTRDCTVLHPSSMSMFNVTIQGRSSTEFPNESAPSSVSTASSGSSTESSWQRKKADQQNENQRSCESQSRKTSKLDLFGFEESDSCSNTEGNSDWPSTYKNKYFGFDDTNHDDTAVGDQLKDGRCKQRRKDRMAAAAKELLAEDTDQPVDCFQRLQDSDPPRPKETKNSVARQETTADVVDFSEEGLKVLAGCTARPPTSKPVEKNPDTFRRIFSAHKKSPTKAVYNARHWTLVAEEETPTPLSSGSQTITDPASAGGSTEEPVDQNKDDGVFKAPPPPPQIPKVDSAPILKCPKKRKELYTVVRQVKDFNDVVEIGENQEFTDDFEYLATGLKSGQPLNTRCLSVISLATRCAMPSFRMHLRARGKVAQVFKTLNDAPQHPNLAMCTASLMYILSRDRLNMDLDRSCLDLMIRLLELDLDQSSGAVTDSASQLSAREIAKMKEKIRKLCDTVHNKHLDLQNITTGHLAMETLLSLTSKRAGDWFKEELRLLGGLDHIVDKVKECVDNLERADSEEKLVSSLWGAERCLRVLESVTVHNPENQSYLIAYKDSSLIVSCAKALKVCEEMIQHYSTQKNPDRAVVGKALENSMRAIIMVLVNLTHDNEWGSTKTGEQPDMIFTALQCVFRVPQYFPPEKRFDIRILGLGLLINLVEYSARNKYCLMEMEMEEGQGPCDSTILPNPQNHDTIRTGPLCAIAALVQLFVQRERAAVLAEAQTDDLIKEPPKPALDQSGEWQETGGEIQWVAKDVSEKQEESKKNEKEEEHEELDLNKALQHAGKHMEDSMVASYTALLLGSLCQGSPGIVETVRDNLPDGDFSVMTEMLKKFLNFMNLTCDIGSAGQKSISRVIDYLEHC
ncbi:wings apart-like protein homolog isoform X1 [Synchiropus splendidus]|uniref:wings apart-like protein homolog isoform X1 n=2 Tax=Synchiropus splendidus TaxID=270530 RepID=UPI00237DF40C|nr:wings apart-like protein homolog isoform X1 [Synchiropus splendidus]